MAVHITPKERAAQFPGELKVTGGKLFCMWCNKLMNHSRRDSILDHLHSKVHQDNRLAKGAQTSIDPNSRDALSRQRKRRHARLKRFGQAVQENDSASSQTQGEESAANLRKLFQESDSDSETSFEGFDSPPRSRFKAKRSFEATDEDESRRSGRSRKRPARLSDSFVNSNMSSMGKVADQAAFVSTMAKKRRATEEYSSPSGSDLSPPARIRSMPIKKQISFTARSSDSTPPTSPSPRGSLKMKFSRAKQSTQEYSVNSEKSMKVVSKSGPGKGLKLKFVWKKKQNSKSVDSSHSNTSDRDSTDLHTSEKTSGYDEMLRGMESTRTEEDKEESKSFEEIVEEEIVEMKDEEVVEEVLAAEGWAPTEDAMIEDQENKVEAERRPLPVPKSRNKAAKPAPAQIEPAAKKIKASKSKKPATLPDDKKRKMTGYMLWAKQMREKVSRQYPGLEFGDVSKKLGDLWKRMPDKEKEMWKFRNTKLERNEQSRPTYVRKSGSKMIETGPKKKPPPVKHHIAPASPPVKNPEAAMRQELSRLPPPSIEALDSAAYLALLGESFGKLSAKTRKMESETVIQGAESVLLDSLVCALAPLISLTRQIPELNDAIDPRTLSNCFSNIAHIMPGL